MEQFTYSLLTRSQRISHENLRLRDAAWLEGYETGWKVAARPAAGSRCRCSRPFAFGLTLKNRIVVSPMATYSAVEACRRTST